MGERGANDEGGFAVTSMEFKTTATRFLIRTGQSSIKTGTAFVSFYDCIPAASEQDRAAFETAPGRN